MMGSTIRPSQLRGIVAEAIRKHLDWGAVPAEMSGAAIVRNHQLVKDAAATDLEMRGLVSGDAAADLVESVWREKFAVMGA